LRMRGGIRIGAAAAIAALIALAANGSAPAQQFPGVFTVTTTADGNDGECTRDCTLREAVSLAAPGTTTSISLRGGVYRLTLGPLVLQESVLILGPGLVGGQGAGARTTIIDARNASRVVEVPANTSSIIAGVTLTGGNAPAGGAATVGAEASLQFFNAIIEGNTATSRGGAVQAVGTVSLQNSLVAGNRVTAGSGGGLAIEANGNAIMLASTLSGNTASVNGGAIASAGNISMTTTTIAGNTAQSGSGYFQEGTDGGTVSIWNTILNGAASGGACGGAIASVARGQWANNLSDDATCLFTGTEGTHNVDSRLGSLANNGGPTDTRALGSGSPAINSGDPNLCFGTDQRGAAAVGVCDVGAFEFGGRPPVAQLPPPIPGETVNVNRSSGIVKVKLPGSDEFFNLRDAQQVPIGSTFDTVKGRVNLVAAANNTGKTQKAWFYEGQFKLAQTKGSKPVTTLKLTGALSCGRSSGATAAAKKKKRRLWGDGKGRFRTQGGSSSATVRGTRWLIEDRCNGTLTKVKRGTVAVRDFKRKKTVIVRAGKQYFARK